MPFTRPGRLDFSGDTGTILDQIWDTIRTFVADGVGQVTMFNAYLSSHLGPEGVYAFWGLIGVIALLVILKAAKLMFDVMRYVLVPAVLVSLVLGLVTPVDSITAFPIAVIIGTTVLLFKS